MRPLLLLVVLLLPSCLHRSAPDETPWCTQALTLPQGRLYNTGVLEKRADQGGERLYLPLAREEERLGLALTRLPDGRIMVCDLIPWGPADRAGLRPGQVLVTDADDPQTALAEAARGVVRVHHGDGTRELRLVPEDHLRGHSTTHLPPLLSISGDASRLDLSLALGVIGFGWNREETAPGELAHSCTFRLFWGLLSF